QNSERFACCGAALAGARGERRASAMRAAWDSSPALLSRGEREAERRLTSKPPARERPTPSPVGSVHHDTDYRALISPRLFDGPPSELSADALVGVQRLDLDLLLGVEAITDLLVVGLLRPRLAVDVGGDVEKLEDS